MSKPIIGITTGEIINAHGTWAPLVYGQSYTYVRAIVRAGGVPILLPLTDNSTVQRELFNLCDGLLIAGGNDVDPELYGESLDGTPKDGICRARDDQELVYIQLAKRKHVPVLAICRGLQLINVARGGTLYQDIATQVAEASDHEDSSHHKNMFHLAHEIQIVPSSKLHSIMNVDKINTNSHHHQGVKEIGEDLLVSARSEDGIIEGLESSTDEEFLMAVQSHPESLEDSVVKEWRNLFDAFLKACQKKKS